MKNLLYIGYYILKTDYSKLVYLCNYSAKVSHRSKLKLYSEMLRFSLIYGSSFADYFYYKLFEKKKEEIQSYAFTSFMYKFFLKINPKSSREFLNNKITFLKKNSKYISRQWLTISDIENDDFQFLFRRFTNKKIVLKNSKGVGGFNIYIKDIKDFNDKKSLINFMIEHKVDLVEEYISQHEDIMKLAPSAVNTIRVVTLLNPDNTVDILGAFMRISVLGKVDNRHQGSFSALVDVDSGVILSNGVYRDISKEDIITHPVTGLSIKGFIVPNWNKVLELTKKMARLNAENKAIGWDIAITNNGVDIVEANHNWNHLIMQQTSSRGIKNQLLSFLKKY